MAESENEPRGLSFVDVTIPQQKGITVRLCLAIVGAVLGSFQFGYNTGVINSPEASIKEFINATEHDRSGHPMSESNLTNTFAVIVAIFAAGGCLGGVSAGWVADKLGRKKGLLMNTLVGIIAGICMYFSKMAKAYEMIIVGRLIVGYNCGLTTGLTPLYLSEVSTAGIRGAVGVLHQLGVVCGVLISQIFGFPEVFGNDEYWPLLLGLTAVPAVLQVLLLPLSPESPRFLLIKKNEEASAVHALKVLHGPLHVDQEIEEMKKEIEAEKKEEKVNIISLFRTSSLSRPLIISIVMHLSQQLSGINGIFYYSSSLFKGAGLDDASATHATSGVGAVLVVMTIITIPLMDRSGRRTLHLVGLSGMFITSILITVTLAIRHLASFINVLSILVSLTYVMFFALGPGSIPWLIVAELFSQGPRPAAISVAVLVNWVANFLVGYTFPHLQNAFGNYTFVPFSVLLFLFVVFTFFFMPETKNKTFEEVSRLWREKDKQKKPAAEDSTKGKKLEAGEHTTLVS